MHSHAIEWFLARNQIEFGIKTGLQMLHSAGLSMLEIEKKNAIKVVFLTIQWATQLLLLFIG